MKQEQMTPYTSYKINKRKVTNGVLNFIIVMRDSKNKLYQLTDIKQKNQHFVPRANFKQEHDMSPVTEEDLLEFAKAKRKIKNALKKA